MCGIAGYMGEGNETILREMVEAIKHRGPDSQGVEIIKNVGLGHARLAILDLSASGHQPMWNEDKTIGLVFNGEIYNFKEVKSLLKNKHTFKSQTDTEVIIHAYEEFGEEVFEKIHGMFAIVLYDTRSKRLILARDRMGKKPLYWGVFNNTFIFGSEPKALMVHPQFKKEIDIDSLNKYFFYEYVPTPYSIFKGVSKLEPGTYLIWDGKEVEKKKYWEPEFKITKNDFSTTIAVLDQVMKKAVADRLVVDVPVGVFLSGGLDSSIIAYFARKNIKIKTFSIGFKEKTFDESMFARKVATHLDTEHYEKILDEKSSLVIIPKIVDMLDEPLADTSIIPTYLLSEFAHEHVTVVLGGDGGDELFNGYDTFIAHKLAHVYDYIPRTIKNIVTKCVSYIPTSFRNMSLDFKLKKFTQGFDGDTTGRNQRWLSPFSEEERKLLFKKEYFRPIKMPVYKTLSHEYQRGYMMDQVLVKVDRASMYTSLEVRAPFLDTQVVNLANSLPEKFKINKFTTKFILKKLMEGKLPKEIIYRKKKGFGVPIAEWIRNDLKKLVLENLSERVLNRIGFFNSAYIQAIIKEHMQGKQDNRKKIWTLFIFALWWRKWVQ